MEGAICFKLILCLRRCCSGHCCEHSWHHGRLVLRGCRGYMGIHVGGIVVGIVGGIIVRTGRANYLLNFFLIKLLVVLDSSEQEEKEMEN